MRHAKLVGDPTAIRKAETRRQKHDRRDAALLLQLLVEGVRTSHHGPQVTEELFGADTVVMQ